MSLGLFGVIQSDPNPDVISMEYPISDFNTFSSLIVREGQVAYIIEEGVLSDPFEAGTHLLNTRNIPVVKEFISLLGNGISPFQNHVYFINKLHQLTGKWKVDGITYTLSQEEFENRPVTFGLSGNIAISVNNPELLLRKLALDKEIFMRDELILELQTIAIQYMKREIVNTIQKLDIDIFRLDFYLSDLSSAVEQAISPIYLDYGIKIESLTVTDAGGGKDWEEIKSLVHDRQNLIYMENTNQGVSIIAAQTDKQKQIIEAEAEAQKVLIDARAHGEETVIRAEANAKDTRIGAESNADRIVTESTARGREKIIDSEADKERFKNLETDYQKERAFNNSDIWAGNPGTGQVASIGTGMAVLPAAAAIGVECSRMMRDLYNESDSPLSNVHRDYFNTGEISKPIANPRNELEKLKMYALQYFDLYVEGKISKEVYMELINKM